MDAPSRSRFWPGVAAFFGGASLLAGGILAGVMLSRPRKSTPMPVWQPVTGDPTTGTIAIPVNASFALAVPSTDPQLSAISGQFTEKGGLPGLAGVLTSAPGTPAPAGFPADGLGNVAWRVTAVNASSAPLVLTITQSTKVWLYAGVTAS